MGQDLKSENLTISIPNKGCNKNCPYCISKMTGYINPDKTLFFKNLDKALTLSYQAETTSVLITGKGEPTLDLETLFSVIAKVNEYNLPTEIQTNGIELKKDNYLPRDLYDAGMNVIAISIDDPIQLNDFKSTFRTIKANNLVIRLTVNITKLLNGLSFKLLLDYCASHDIDQLTLRRIVPPENPKDLKVAKWIEENAPTSLYDDMICEAKRYIDNRGKLIRQLSHGVNIYDLDGVAFTYSDYCIQEYNIGNNIRSLIYQENGHLYTSWNSRASILF